MAGLGWARIARVFLGFLVWGCLTVVMASPSPAADGPRLLRQGEEHYQFGEWDRAQQTLNQALAAGGLSPAQRARAYFHLGLVAEAMGDQAAAATHFSQAKAADPGWRPAPGEFPATTEARFERAPNNGQAGAEEAGSVRLPAPPSPPVSGPAAQSPSVQTARADTIREQDIPPTAEPVLEPTPEPRFDQQDLIEKRRQARLTFVEGVDLFNAGRYAEAEQRFLAFLAVFPGDPEGSRFLRLTQRTLASLRSGSLRVASRQPATVYLDGRPVGETPLALDNLPLGRHLVEVRAGELSQSQAIEIKGGTTSSIEFDLTRHEVPTEVVPAAGDGYRHPVLGFALLPPPGWRETEKPDQADLRLAPAGGQGYIQIDSVSSERQLDVATYALLWEGSFLAKARPGTRRLTSQARGLAAGPAWQAEYQDDEARTMAVFVSRPQRMYVLTGVWANQDHEAMRNAFAALVESFRAP